MNAVTHHHRGRTICSVLGRIKIKGHNRFCVPGAGLLIWGDGSVDTVDHRHRDVQRQVFAAQVGPVRSMYDTGRAAGRLSVNRGNAASALRRPAASPAALQTPGRRVLEFSKIRRHVQVGRFWRTQTWQSSRRRSRWWHPGIAYDQGSGPPPAWNHHRPGWPGIR